MKRNEKKKKTFMCFGSILLSFPSKLLKKKKKVFVHPHI